uniref:Uncharacterized protein n=1 Tax=Moniliophthora roreri TaxID=221103 RepID=A0A0W0FS79_MONRR
MGGTDRKESPIAPLALLMSVVKTEKKNFCMLATVVQTPTRSERACPNSAVFNIIDRTQIFKQDFKQFSRIKNPGVVQLFGYNNTLPALIFYDALILLTRIILVQDHISPILYTYFAYQFNKRRITDEGVDIGELWIDPRTGALCRGPYISFTSNRTWMVTGFGHEPHLMGQGRSSLLSVQTYSDLNAVVDYLTGALSIRAILRGIGWSSGGIGERLTDEAVHQFSTLAGTIYNTHHRESIYEWAEARERWHYGLWRVDDIPEAMRKSQMVMEDGSVRFMLTPMDIQHVRRIVLRYSLLPGEDLDTLGESWLAQAYGVFSRLQIDEGKWDQYAMSNGFWLGFHRKKGHQMSEENADIMLSVYFFIGPIPSPSEHETSWKSWTEGRKYFWSFDPSGQERLSKAAEAALGLPSFMSSIENVNLHWHRHTYEAVHRLHLLQGSNPATTDLVRNIGLPVLRAVKNCAPDYSLDWEDSTDISDILGFYADFELDKCSSTLEKSDSDSDIVLYPRQESIK